MEDQTTAAVRKKRVHRAMALQQKIARERGEAHVGKTIRVLAESEKHGRSEADAPDVDGRVIFDAPRVPGTFTEVVVRGHDIYDLYE
jgi:ribosomal protein S12 methylthiotransferase